MGKFLFKTLLIVVLLVNPAFAEEFSFISTAHSKWVDPIKTQLDIVSNNMSGQLLMTNGLTGYSELCIPIAKKDTAATFQCEGRTVEATYSKGVIHFNGVPYKRLSE